MDDRLLSSASSRFLSNSFLGSLLDGVCAPVASIRDDIIFLYSQQPYLLRLALKLIAILGSSFFLVRSLYYRFLCKYKGIQFNQISSEQPYDYIIVGAGSAGCVLANRISSSPLKPRVLLLEAGGRDDSIYVSIPAAAIKLQRTDIDWVYQTIPQSNSQRGMNGNKSNWPRGKCLGGCSSLNYLLWVRGDQQDFDEWEKKGAIHWAWKDVLPYFMKCENTMALHPTIRSKDEKLFTERGKDGPIHIEQLKTPHLATEAFINASIHSGFPYIPDYNTEERTGVSHCQYSMKNGERCSTSTAYLLPVIEKENLTILTHAHVTQLLFNQNKECIGVKYRRGKFIEELNESKEFIIYSNKEVLLSAGAISSPHLLMLSGIGPASHLHSHSIPLIVDLPGVGNNLQDHLFVPIVYKSLIPTLSNKSETISNILQWIFQRKGELCSPMVEAFIFLHSAINNQTATGQTDTITTRSNNNKNNRNGRSKEKQEIQAPNGETKQKKVCDIQIHFAQGTGDSSHLIAFNHNEILGKIFLDMIEKEGGHTTTVMPGLVRPTSRGTIRLKDNNPFSAPLIDPNYLSTQQDLDRLVSACEIADSIYQQPQMSSINGKSPVLLSGLLLKNEKNLAVKSREWWAEYVRALAMTIYHPTSTCAMGRLQDPNSVVTPDLFVKGLKRLRIVDASVFPDVTSGNTNAPVIMLAEKASELVLDTLNSSFNRE